ncbi:MAG: CBS domain-containing protein, partial [Planctomycetota bacterium]
SLFDVWLGEDQSIAEIMVEDIVTVLPTAPIDEMAGLMAENRIHRLVVVENNLYVGLVTSLDLLKHFSA